MAQKTFVSCTDDFTTIVATHVSRTTFQTRDSKVHSRVHLRHNNGFVWPRKLHGKLIFKTNATANPPASKSTLFCTIKRGISAPSSYVLCKTWKPANHSISLQNNAPCEAPADKPLTSPRRAPGKPVAPQRFSQSQRGDQSLSWLHSISRSFLFRLANRAQNCLEAV